ncbi:N-6 DNA methylase [Bacteroides sp. GM023]|uniref:N-6 DNA methylase n=1 Tax=Bacteroides sp. GM023 TaxID=2723058 RepID=UPI00168C01FD|nr:N-6 DNA methylase [Bacteroides sp. GM023]MBD3589560.1 SAM-dependent DNA methyltransferase [Bacteroides sp. GM023]
MKNNDFKTFGEYLEGISRIHGRAKVFDDFLQIIVCCLSMGRKEELYFKTIKPYDREELNLFSQAFASLVMQMDSAPLDDPFGDYYEEFLSDSRNGQFFTPMPICDLMTQLTTAVKPGEERKSGDVRVYDPTCGSGRLLLSAAKQDRKQFFVGADISYSCCLMTIINLCLNSLNGEVLHMNTLSFNCWHHWCVIVDSFTKIPTVYEVNPDKLNQAPTQAAELKPQPVKGLIQPVESVPAISFVRYTKK